MRLRAIFWGIKINEKEREREKVGSTHVYRVLEHHDWARTVSVARRTWQLLAGNQSSWSPRCGVFMEARGNRLETHKGKKFTPKFVHFRVSSSLVKLFSSISDYFFNVACSFFALLFFYVSRISNLRWK